MKREQIKPTITALRKELKQLELPSPDGICTRVNHPLLFSKLAFHVMRNPKPHHGGYWLLPLDENGNYVLPNHKDEHPVEKIECRFYYRKHIEKRNKDPHAPMLPMDLAREKLVADVVALIDKILQDEVDFHDI